MILKNFPEEAIPFQAVVFMPYFEDGRTILLQKKIDHPAYPNKFGFPAGKIRESDLTVENAVRREVFEETRIELDGNKLIGPLKTFHKHQKLNGEIFYFIGYTFAAKMKELPQIILDPKEHRQYKEIYWSDLVEASAHKHIFIPDAIEVMELFQLQFGSQL